MILADKIIALRKKAGWSQEELAEQLGVSRQAVSKWEGAQSVPDMERILQMSKAFGVTTDYLLKDELEAEEYAASEPDTELHRVTMEDAARYLDLRKAAAPKMALATFLCIISAIPLLLLGAWSESADAPITENAAAGLGLCALLLLVAVGVAIFLTTGAKAKAFAFLEKEPFETAYGVSGMVKERRTAFQNTYDRLNVVGTVLCILSVLPLFAAVCFDGSDLSYVISVAAMFLIAGIGCRVRLWRDIQCSHAEAIGRRRVYKKEKSKERAARHDQYLLLAHCRCDLSVYHIFSVHCAGCRAVVVCLADRRRAVYGGHDDRGKEHTVEKAAAGGVIAEGGLMASPLLLLHFEARLNAV